MYRILAKCLKALRVAIASADRRFFRRRHHLLNELLAERDEARHQRDQLAADREKIVVERDALVHERNMLGELRYRFEHERDVARAEIDKLRNQLNELLGEPGSGRIGEEDCGNTGVALLSSQGSRERLPASQHAMDAAEPRRTLIFIHIAKTGGATLGSVLNAQFPSHCILTAGEGSSDSALGIWSVRPFIEKLGSLAPEEKEKFRLVAGHFMFGIHESLGLQAEYVTVMRHPVDRVISSYYYILDRPEIPIHDVIVRGELSLVDYIKSGAGLDPHNYQTRIFAGKAEYDRPWTNTKDAVALRIEALNEAKKNVTEHFALAGTTEQFDQLLIILKLLYGWPLERLLYVRKNETVRRPRLEEVPASTIRLIEEHNQLDLELYEFVKQRFAQEQDKWQAQLAYLLPRFKSLNQIYAHEHGGVKNGKISRPLATLCARFDARLSQI